jgi:phage terminase small subunit
LVAKERRTLTAMRPYLAGLGLTPSSRSRLIGEAPLDEADDPFAKFEKPA